MSGLAQTESVFADIVEDLRLHGWEEFRAATHAMIYGFKELRFSLPLKPSTDPRSIANNRAAWARMKARQYDEFPGVKLSVQKKLLHTGNGDKPSVVDAMSPVVPPGGDALRSNGSAIEVPVIDRRTGQAVPMPARKIRKIVGRPCPVPGCGERARGKHVQAHRNRGEWDEAWNTPAANRMRGARVAAPASAPPAVKAGPSPKPFVSTEVEAAFDVLRKALASLPDLIRERDYYKGELAARDEAIQRMDAALSTIKTRGRR